MDGSVIAGLRKRDAERQLDVQQKRTDRNRLHSEHEHFAYFTALFHEKLTGLEALLAVAVAAEPAGHAFDQLSQQVLQLHKLVADSVLFLRGYDIRVCQRALQEFEARAKRLQDARLPKKKFGFKRNRPAKPSEQTLNESVPHDAVDGGPKKPTTTTAVTRVKLDEMFFGFRGERDAVLELHPDALHERDVSLHELRNCVVRLHGAPNTLHLSQLHGCVVLAGPVSTSIFADGCTDCQLSLAGQQLRLHRSTRCDVYLHVTSRAILEDCTRIRVAPYNYTYDSVHRDFRAAGLEPALNHWQAIDDFNWLVLDKHSPNWSVLPEARRVHDWHASHTALQ